jgi:hypothetical protein
MSAEAPTPVLVPDVIQSIGDSIKRISVPSTPLRVDITVASELLPYLDSAVPHNIEAWEFWELRDRQTENIIVRRVTSFLFGTKAPLISFRKRVRSSGEYDSEDWWKLGLTIDYDIAPGFENPNVLFMFIQQKVDAGGAAIHEVNTYVPDELIRKNFEEAHRVFTDAGLR